MRRLSSFLLITLLALASCVPTPNPEEYDWCYYYNFAIFDYDATMINGDWVDGEGFVSDDGEPNALRFSITKSGFSVQPSLVSLTVARPSWVTGSITAEGVGSIYEADATIPSTTLDSEWTEQTIWAESTDGDFGNLIYVEIQSDQPLAVTGISVHGNGATPFESNPCAPATPTVPGTATTEASATQTLTLTPSVTFTPTTTATCQDVNPVPIGYSAILYGGGYTFYRYNGASTPAYFEIPNPWPEYSFYVTSILLRAGRVDGQFSGVSHSLVDESFVYIEGTGGTLSLDSTAYSTSNGGRTQLINFSSPYVSGAVYYAFDQYSGSQYSAYSDSSRVTVCRGVLNPVPTATLTSTYTRTPTPTRTPLGGGTVIPSRTPTRTMIPPVFSPTPVTPTITNTPEPTLPPATAPATLTLIPNPTLAGSSTAIATYPVPGFTDVPAITAVVTSEAAPTQADLPDHSGVYDLLATAAAEVGNLPGGLEPYVPNPDADPLFGYMKWLVSCTAAQDILGQNVGTMMCHVVVGLTLLMILSAVALSIRIIVYVMRFAIWIVGRVLELIQTVRG